MTLGEKLKEARKQHGLTQEELAAKLCVSRAAVAKWESDKGIPDTENLKAISRLLGVSIDYLLANDAEERPYALREPYDLQSYRRPGEKLIGDAQLRAVDAKFPDADIIYCHPEKILTKSEKLVDFAVLCFTPLPDICDIINNLKDVEDGTAFFLIDDGGRHYLVYINREFMETSEFPGPLPTKRFRVGDYQLTPGRVYRPGCKQRLMDPEAAASAPY